MKRRDTVWTVFVIVLFLLFAFYSLEATEGEPPRPPVYVELPAQVCDYPAEVVVYTENQGMPGKIQLITVEVNCDEWFCSLQDC